MTSEEVSKIMEDNHDDFLKSDSKNGFLDGLLILNRLSDGKESYAAEHDIFYANSLDDMPGITEQDVIELNKLGWHYDNEFECFANFV